MSGLEGHLFRFPLIGVSFGISSIAEIQLDGGLYNRLSITQRNVGRWRIWSPQPATRPTASRTSSSARRSGLVSEGVARPAIGFRFATRLPNASNESGIGLDTTDFFASLLFGKTVRSIRVVGNGGLGILGDPDARRPAERRPDVRRVVGARRHGGGGAGRRDQRPVRCPQRRSAAWHRVRRGIFRLGARYTIGGWRGDASLFFGLTSNDPQRRLRRRVHLRLQRVLGALNSHQGARVRKRFPVGAGSSASVET